MGAKPTKNNRRSPGVASRKSELSESEYRFDRLAEEDYDDCFRYEIQRANVPRLRTKLQRELATIPANVAMPIEPEEVEGSLFARKHDLEEQLEMLKEYQRPWLELDAKGKAPFKTAKKPIVSRICEPVLALDRLDLVGRAFLMLAESGEVEKLTLVIDWTEPDTALTKSFSRLLGRMRKHRGKAAHLLQRRGRPSSPIENKLFALAVWRCSQHGMTYEKTWEFLVPVSKKMNIAASNKRILWQFSKMLKQLLG